VSPTLIFSRPRSTMLGVSDRLSGNRGVAANASASEMNWKMSRVPAGLTLVVAPLATGGSPRRIGR
jgi:hypothetical protein